MKRPVPKTPGQMLHRLRELKDKKDVLEAQVKEINIEIVKIEQDLLPNALMAADLDKISEAGVGSAKLGTRVFVNVHAHNKPAMLDWMRENGHGALIKEEIHHKTLEAWASEALMNGFDYPDEIMNITAIPAVKFRRS